MKQPEVLKDNFGYQQDVIDRALWLPEKVESVGACSLSVGTPAMRQTVTDFVQRRDEFPEK